MLRHLKLGGSEDAALTILKGFGACAIGVAVATLFAQTTLFERLGNWLYDSLQELVRPRG